MSKADDTTHIYILAIHIFMAVVVLIAYFDIKKEIKEVREVDLPELQSQILQEL